ncbi:unnamed protein product [Amoebophrya sp. A120]|nr:unnamed protein product [Amoebophrya sp. A120]|eukprot:GSA120T00018689001.1
MFSVLIIRFFSRESELNTFARSNFARILITVLFLHVHLVRTAVEQNAAYTWDPTKLLWRGQRVGFVLDQLQFSAVLPEGFSKTGDARGTFFEGLELPDEFTQFQPTFEQMLEHFVEKKFVQRVDLAEDFAEKELFAAAGKEESLQPSTRPPRHPTIASAGTTSTTTSAARRAALRRLVQEVFTSRQSPGFIRFHIQQSNEGDEKAMKMPDGNNQMVHSDNYLFGGVYYIASDRQAFMTTVYSSPRDKVGQLGHEYAIYAQDGTAYHSSKPHCAAEGPLVASDRSDKEFVAEQVRELLPNDYKRSVARRSVRTFFRVWFWHPTLVRDSLLAPYFRRLEEQTSKEQDVERKKLESFAAICSEWGYQTKTSSSGGTTAALEIFSTTELSTVLEEGAAASSAGATGASAVAALSTQTDTLTPVQPAEAVSSCATEPIADRPSNGCPTAYARDNLLSGRQYESAEECKALGAHLAVDITFSKSLSDFRHEVKSRMEKTQEEQKRDSLFISNFFYTANDLPLALLNTIRGSCFLRGGSAQAVVSDAFPLGSGLLAKKVEDVFSFPHANVHTNFLQYKNPTNSVTGFLDAIEQQAYEVTKKHNTDLVTMKALTTALQEVGVPANLDGDLLHSYDAVRAFFSDEVSPTTLKFHRLENQESDSNTDEEQEKPTHHEDAEDSLQVLKSFVSPLTDMNFVTEEECAVKCQEFNFNQLLEWTFQFGNGDPNMLRALLEQKFSAKKSTLNPRFCFAYTFIDLNHGGDPASFYTPEVSGIRLEQRCLQKTPRWNRSLPKVEDSGRKKIESKTVTVSTLPHSLTDNAANILQVSEPQLLSKSIEFHDCPEPMKTWRLQFREPTIIKSLRITPWKYSRAVQQKLSSVMEKSQRLRVLFDGRDFDTLAAAACTSQPPAKESLVAFEMQTRLEDVLVNCEEGVAVQQIELQSAADYPLWLCAVDVH